MKTNIYNKSVLFLLLIFVAIISISIGYCNVNERKINITGTIEAGLSRILYIDSIEVDEQASTEGARYDSYTTENTLLQISAITLPKENVTEDTNITILVNVNNLSDLTYCFKGTSYLTQADVEQYPFLSVMNSNPNIKLDESLYQDLIDTIIDANTIDGTGQMTVPLKFKYIDINNITDNKLDISIKLNFEKKEKQSYKLKTGRNLYDTISTYQTDTNKILFCAKSEVPEGATEIGNVGEIENQIKAYYKEQTIYIASITKISIIEFNEDSGYMFSSGNESSAFYNVKSIEVSNGVTINTSNVKYFEEMFKGCKSLTTEGIQKFLNKFDTSSAINMCAMFGSTSGIKELDLSGFDTSNVTDMSWMFEENTNLVEINLGGKFNTSSVEGSIYNQAFAGMFINCSSLTYLDLTNFETSKAKSMYQMFKNCYNLEKIYATDKFVTTGLATNDAKNSSELFTNCQDLSGDNGTMFSTKKVTNSSYAHLDGGEENPGYFSVSKNYTVTLDPNGGTFETGDSTPKIYTEKNKVKITFKDIVPVTEKKFFAGWSEDKNSTEQQYTRNDTKIFLKDTKLYAIWVDRLGVKLKNGQNVFEVITDYKQKAEHIKFVYKDNIPEGSTILGNLDEENSGIIEAHYNEELKTIYFAIMDENYNTIVFNENSAYMFSNGKNATDAFSKVKTIDVDESIKIDTSKVQSFAEIFKHNESLEQESFQKFIDKFDTRSATNLCAMFEYISISEIDISKFDTRNATDISWMFHGAKLTNIIYGDNFNTSKVKKFDGMFQEMPNMIELDASKIKISEGATIDYMFGLCSNLQRIYVSEDNGFENAAVGGSRVFENDIKLVGGTGENETKFTSSQISGTYARISTKDTPGYFTNINEKN